MLLRAKRPAGVWVHGLHLFADLVPVIFCFVFNFGFFALPHPRRHLTKKASRSPSGLSWPHATTVGQYTKTLQQTHSKNNEVREIGRAVSSVEVGCLEMGTGTEPKWIKKNEREHTYTYKQRPPRGGERGASREPVFQFSKVLMAVHIRE